MKIFKEFINEEKARYIKSKDVPYGENEFVTTYPNEKSYIDDKIGGVRINQITGKPEFFYPRLKQIIFSHLDAMMNQYDPLYQVWYYYGKEMYFLDKNNVIKNELLKSDKNTR